MGWVKPSPAHGPIFFETKTMGGLDHFDFFMGTHGPRASTHGLSKAHGLNFDSKKLVYIFH